MEALRKEDRYTYSDYCSWDDGERWEIIEGSAFAMAPAPSPAHQSVSMGIAGRLHRFLEGKPCKVFASPIDVRLNAESEDNTVVQPDIIVVCDRSKIGSECIVGAPDLVVEILSPSTARRDRGLKFKTYRLAGVREYWIADPESKTVSIHILQDGEYVTRAYTEDEIAPVHVLEGCTINLAEVFNA